MLQPGTVGILHLHNPERECLFVYAPLYGSVPKLKAYTDNSPKSGYYILANVGGSHPITLQVTDLGKQILRRAGYGGGDNVPTKVVWSMFDLGILYTSGPINHPHEIVDDPDETFRKLGVANKLTEQEKNQLLNYLKEYSGPNQAEIDTLRETLKGSGEATQGGAAMPNDIPEADSIPKEATSENEELKRLCNSIAEKIIDNNLTRKGIESVKRNQTKESSLTSVPSDEILLEQYSSLDTYIQSANESTKTGCPLCMSRNMIWDDGNPKRCKNCSTTWEEKSRLLRKPKYTVKSGARKGETKTAKKWIKEV